MVLKPQDLVVLLKLAAQPEEKLPYNRLALDLHMPVSAVHAAVKRCLRSGLAAADPRPRPIVDALIEFLFHGARYAFPAELGGPVRGMPTAFAAPPLKGIMAPSDELPPVWPYVEGQVRGPSLAPLYRSAPLAARDDENLYVLLALVDAIRIGGARERQVAMGALGKELRAGE